MQRKYMPMRQHCKKILFDNRVSAYTLRQKCWIRYVGLIKLCYFNTII